MIKIYRKITAIQAEQFDGSQKMIDEYDIIPAYEKNSENEYWQPVFPCSILMTKKGALSINVGDWVATGINGEHWPIADDVFKKTYADLPVIPDYVDDYINYMKSSGRDIWDAIHYPYRSNDISEYMEDNSETFARAWLNGYQVEAENV